MPVPAPPPPDTFIRMPEDAARHQLKLALGRLSRTQRHVMLLRLRGESDLDRIATRLDLEPAAVRASLAFANAQLRMMLSDTPQDPERNDWLLRCQALLMQQPPATAATSEQPLPDTEPVPGTSAINSGPEPAVPVDMASPAATAESSSPSTPPDTTPQPDRNTSAPTERTTTAFWLLPWLPGAMALLVLISLALLAWQVLSPPAPTATTTAVTSPERSEPERMPPSTAPEAPLTAPDFSLVLLRQQHPGLLEDLDFLVWLSEQESFQ